MEDKKRVEYSLGVRTFDQVNPRSELDPSKRLDVLDLLKQNREMANEPQVEVPACSEAKSKMVEFGVITVGIAALTVASLVLLPNNPRYYVPVLGCMVFLHIGLSAIIFFLRGR